VSTSSSQTGIAVTAKRFALNFLMLLFKPVVEIDGHEQQGSWGTTFLPVAPGEHRIAVYWKYLFVMPANRASATVIVTEGATAEVTYQARWMMFLRGKITVSQAVAAAS
jgi:hypothetical protein